MLTLEDILGVCECTEEEIEAIAMHEHVPTAVAAELSEYLIHCDDGIPRIKEIILEDIEEAHAYGQRDQVEWLYRVLAHFVVSHPEYEGKAR
jgi:hypothetical protein